MFSSACFYKYFSIDWKQLKTNLNNDIEMAVHTIGAFLRSAATSNPTGKQNSFAAHNPPDGILIELRDSPVSYANAFADPVSGKNNRGIIGQSIAQLAQYSSDIKTGYGEPFADFWFSPNLRYKLDDIKNSEKIPDNYKNSLDELTEALINALSKKFNLSITWQKAKEAVLDENNRLNQDYINKLVNHEPNK
jgi:CRISPR system Cascade subunit CasC